MEELALVAYTTLMQLAVGSFITIELIRFFSTRKASALEANRLTNRVVYALGPIAAVGMLSSFLHLKVPLLSLNVLAKFGGSWMNLEIWFSLIFTGLVIAYSIIIKLSKVNLQLLKSIFAIVTSLVGLALVYCMARAYMIDTYPAWNTLATPVTFYVTTFLLGTVFIGAAIVANYHCAKKKDPDCGETSFLLLGNAVKWITLAAIVALGVEMITIPLHLSYLAFAEIPAAALSTGFWGGLLLALRLALVFVGAGILGIFVYRNAVQPNQKLRMSNLIYVVFALVFVAEVVGRFLFYATGASIVI